MSSSFSRFVFITSNSKWISFITRCAASRCHHARVSFNARRLLCAISSSNDYSATSVNINSDNKLLLSSNNNSFTDKISQMLKDSTCNGCGAPLQYSQPNTGGYIPEKRLQSMLQSDENSEAQDQIVQSTLICQRCFYLKHYNTALNVMLSPDHYISHLSYLKDERALIMCLIDVIDYPSSLFPQLHSILNSVNSTVYIVANKIDLLPDVNKKSLRKVEDFIRSEASGSLRDIAVSKVLFVSAKTGEGIYELTEAVVNEWGNRGNVYLIGCTNVGKSSLFNRLLVTLCGAKPGQVRTMSQVSAPSPTISHWPGTTLGLLRFPLLSYGKRRRLLSRASKMGVRLEDMINEGFHDDVFDNNQHTDQASEEIQEVLADVGLKKKTKEKIKPFSLDVPQNRFWLHDTPGAVNDLQSINYLTTKELKLVLPKKRLSPRTYILKPGMALFIGGMARIDYTEGDVSVYFTVFAGSYLPVHATQMIKADDLYQRNLGKALLKIPAGDGDRLERFPPLQSREFEIEGIGWKNSSCDIILSSSGWVSVTVGKGEVIKIDGYTPNGKGIYMRSPSLWPSAVTERGIRSQTGNRSSFTAKKKKIQSNFRY